MANQAANPPAHVPAAAHVVGNAFVNQYYNVLHQSPQVVHRFYTDASRLTRAEAGADGAVDTVGTQREIYMKVMSSDYNDLKAEIKTVDSQDSHGGGVLVLVTGSLSTKSNEKRNFVQSFFLAPQEKGYFVLNDIFRYLDVETHRHQLVLPRVESDEPAYIPEPPVVHQPVPEPALEHHVSVPEPEVVREITPALESEPPVEEVHDLSVAPSAEAEDEVGPSPVENMTTPVIEEPESPMVQNTPAAHVQEPEPTGETPKKHSYASIVKVVGTPIKASPQPVVERPAATPSPSPAPVPAPAPVHVPAPVAAPTPVPSLPEEAQEKIAPVENEADGRSVYVKNLPMNCTVPELEMALSEFGPVKPGGVNVKNQKQGVCYAFVEFEEATGAHSAIEASHVTIRGRQAYIEEKKTMGRGARRSNDNRGDRPYRSDRMEGGRGRGTYGGRSYGRGMGQDSRERDGGMRGGRGGSGPPRGAYPNSNGTGEPAYSGGERRTDGQRAPRRNTGAPQTPRSNGPTVAPV